MTDIEADDLLSLIRDKRRVEERLKTLVAALRVAIEEGRNHGSESTRSGRVEAADRIDRTLQYHLRTWEAEDRL